VCLFTAARLQTGTRTLSRKIDLETVGYFTTLNSKVKAFFRENYVVIPHGLERAAPRMQ